MKKLTFMLAAVLVCGLALSGCKSPAGESGNGGNGEKVYRWSKWVNTTDDPTLRNDAVEFSIDSGDLVTINVNQTSTTVWYINVKVQYTATRNSKYRLTFDARAESARNVAIFFGIDSNAIRSNFDLTTGFQTFTFDIPDNAQIGQQLRVDFNCANSLVTFYIKNLSIVPIL